MEKVMNVKPNKEGFHKDKQIQISVPTANGKIEKPKEWYLVSLDEIEASINDIIVNLNS